MKKFYKIYQTKNFEKGGDFLSHFLGEGTIEEIVKVAIKKSEDIFCELTIYQVEQFNDGSERKTIIWQGINTKSIYNDLRNLL